MADAVHVTPRGDLIVHVVDEDGGCVCGPSVVPNERGDGSIGWIYVHPSLDGREYGEALQLG